MKTSVSILIGSILIAAAVLFVFRWDVVAGQSNYRIIRLDRWTGTITQCESKGFQNSPDINEMVCANK